MKPIPKILVVLGLLFSPLAVFAGYLNFGLSYIQQKQNIGLTTDVYNGGISWGQTLTLGKKASMNIYETVNYVTTPLLTFIGIGGEFGIDLAFKMVAQTFPKPGFEMEFLAGGYVESTFLLNPFNYVLTYGPSMGLAFKFWLSPGFGLQLQAKNGFNLSSDAEQFIYPSVMLGMIWRKVDKTEQAFGQEKKKVKTSTLNAGIYQKEGNVMFVYESPRTDITSINIVGDFNNWDMQSVALEEDGGVWKVILKLDPGLYQYKYVINGSEKIVDPKSPGFTSDGEGGKNSILEVEED